MTIVEKITKTSEFEQKKSIYFFARMPFDIKLNILNLQMKKFYILKDKYKNTEKNILMLSSFVLAINDTKSEMNETKIKVLKIQDNIKNTKRRQLIDKWSLIKNLRFHEKLSFREIAKYLTRYHKMEVGYTTIYNLWQELENNSKKGE